MNAICSQLLTQNDLKISDELYTRVQEEGIVTSILENNDLRSIKIFSKEQLYLSQITPVLHAMGFTIIDEVTYNLSKDTDVVHVSRFNLHLDDTSKIEKSQQNIEEIVALTLKDDNIEHSKAYSLIYNENFSIRKIKLLRSLVEYLDQAVLSINTIMIKTTLTTHHTITNMFIDYFYAKFDPKCKTRVKKLNTLEEHIDEAIKKIPDIFDDRILKLMFSVLKALLRTNYFLDKETISFKINTASLKENLKGLQPNLENFVYHPDFYGIHLRMSKISRGGLRWSNRHEDYRQEVKSLMITQESKNSIIIPDGAKGGFVINKDSNDITKEFFQEVYKKYINAMLDLVDNMVDGEVVKNPEMVCYDDDDAYFVVAADKGTASMSDVANEISLSRGYWLGDAFASGGSNGYGHKDLGITARGSIMSTKRFFIEEGIDIYKDEVSVVGLGSMNGDVFGNGLIESEKFKLLAAISQKEIFIDPSPDTQKAFIERKRLFFDKNSGWKHYDKKVISKGGGVYLRSEKSIELTKEVQNMLKVTATHLSGEELCQLLLTMEADMLFNGGVGTYVKASEENNLDIGDKQNEAVRVDASDLRARVVCEGGNLGFTQKARIEYALNGGRLNVDGLDNAGGVDTSDREVNLKILLNSVKDRGVLCEDETRTTLQSLTDQIVFLVLDSNYQQSLAISRDERLSKVYLSDFLQSVEILEHNLPSFKRKDFFIPKNENIDEVLNINQQIVRPVLCSIFSYAKIFVKKILLESELIDEAFATKFLFKYFPQAFVGAYEKDILGHPLKREIIATKIADFVINYQGSTFISDFEKLGLEKFILKIKSYIIASELLTSRFIREEIHKEDYKMDIELQYKLINKIEYTLYSSTRWMVKYLKKNQVDIGHILDYKDELFEFLSEVHKQEVEVLIEGNDSFNLFFSVNDYLRFAVAAIVIKENSTHSFKDVIVLFYTLIHEFNILEIIIALNKVKIVTKKDMTLRNQILQFVEYIVVHYTKEVLEFQRVNESPEEAFKSFVQNEKDVFYKVRDKLDKFVVHDDKDIKDIAVTVNQMMVSLI